MKARPRRNVGPPSLKASLAKNRVYVITVAGYTFVTFATGGIADWFPTFLSRVRKMPLSEVDLAIGVSAVVGGLAMLPAVVLTAIALFFFSVLGRLRAGRPAVLVDVQFFPQRAAGEQRRSRPVAPLHSPLR